jgi:hypothetical protein
MVHGVAGAAVGPRTAICAGGLLTMSTVALVARTTPALWHYQPDHAGS